MNVHEILVAERFHTDWAFALASLEAIINAFLANNMAANGDGSVLEAPVADTICDLLCALLVHCVRNWIVQTYP
jgi:hypothetical protein